MRSRRSSLRRRALRPTTICRYRRLAASSRPTAEAELDAGAALHVAERALNTDAGINRVPLPGSVVPPPPVVVMTAPMPWPMPVSVARSVLRDVQRARDGGCRCRIRNTRADADGGKSHSSRDDQCGCYMLQIDHG